MRRTQPSVRPERGPSLLNRLLRSLSGSTAPASLEALEARLALSTTPLPTLADLENSANAVVRFETTSGDIDIELFSTVGPRTTANFLRYVTSGRYDETFFHRSVSSFVIQGGGFEYDDRTGADEVEEFERLQFEATNRSNVERTIAMARIGADENSASSQFFFNLGDNSELDNSSSGRFAVFGRVIQGWDAVQRIAQLSVRNLQNDPAFVGQPFQTAMGEVPVNPSFDPSRGVRESSLVNIIDAEVIKPAGNTGFYTQTLVYPEGFRSPGSSEFIEVANPNGVNGVFQVIARYEFDDRDIVIAQGFLDANETTTINLAAPDVDGTAGPDNPGVRAETPYSLTIQTSLPAGAQNPRPILASSNRRDFGAATGESFFNITGAAAGSLRTWDFPRVERSATSREFLTWTNLVAQTVNVTVTFVREGALTESVVVAGEGYRRGGLDFSDLGIPDGVYSVRVTADQDIVAALSDWDLPAAGINPNGAYTPAFGQLGVTGGGAAQGAFGNVQVLPDHASILSVMNMGTNLAVVTFEFWTTGRAPGDPVSSQTRTVSAQSRTDFDVSAVAGLPAGTPFTVTYRSGVAPVAVSYTLVDNVGRNLNTGKRADGAQAAFVSGVPAATYFTNGTMDPNRDASTQNEVLSVWSPFRDPAVELDFVVTALFADGSTLELTRGTLGATQRADVNLSANTALRQRVGLGTLFQTYTIAVTGTTRGLAGSQIDTSGIASMVRRDTTTGRAMADGGIHIGSVRPLTDPIFLPSGNPMG